MSTIICPICSSSSVKVYDWKFDKYTLYSCGNCHVVFCDPFKAPAAEFYAEAKDQASNVRHNKLKPWPASHPATRSVHFKNGEGKDLLDIGCGNGSFVEFASQRGFNVTGIDFDATSLNAAKKRNFRGQANFYNIDLEDFLKKNPDRKFDIITAFEVVEHLDNTNRVMELVHAMLKPQGLFIGSLPNRDRIWMKKVNMVYEVPPYHLSYWTPASWKGALESIYGFSHLYSKNNIFYGYISYAYKHKILSKTGLTHKKNIQSFFLRSFYKVTGFGETMIEKLLEKGASFYFEARKNSSL